MAGKETAPRVTGLVCKGDGRDDQPACLDSRELLIGTAGIGAQQLWRHGHDYVFPSHFVTVEPGKIFRGAWQKPWPMRAIVHDHKIKTVLALAHPADHYLTIQERKLASELGVNWVHVPIVDNRGTNDRSAEDAISDLLDEGRRHAGRSQQLSDLLSLPPRPQPHVDGSNRISNQVLRLDAPAGRRRDRAHRRARQGEPRARLPAHDLLLREPGSPPGPADTARLPRRLSTRGQPAVVSRRSRTANDLPMSAAWKSYGSKLLPSQLVEPPTSHRLDSRLSLITMRDCLLEACRHKTQLDWMLRQASMSFHLAVNAGFGGSSIDHSPRAVRVMFPASTNRSKSSPIGD